LPKTKTAEKSARSSERKAERNKAIKSGTKSKITRAEKLIATKKGAEAGAAVTEAISSLDRAAKRKVMHANTAARKKSRLMKKLNASQKK
jgi:small subunit ribosomal protein S20